MPPKKLRPASAPKKAAPSKPKAGKADAGVLFKALRAILEPYAPRLAVKEDTATHLYLTSKKPYKGKDLMFAATTVRSAYVSFYLFPIYMYPELMDGASPALAQCHPGKSCFNFKKADPEVLKELAEVTRRGFERFEREGLV